MKKCKILVVIFILFLSIFSVTQVSSNVHQPMKVADLKDDRIPQPYAPSTNLIEPLADPYSNII